MCGPQIFLPVLDWVATVLPHYLLCMNEPRTWANMLLTRLHQDNMVLRTMVQKTGTILSIHLSNVEEVPTYLPLPPADVIRDVNGGRTFDQQERNLWFAHKSHAMFKRVFFVAECQRHLTTQGGKAFDHTGWNR